MRRGFLATLLFLGGVGGYAAGFAHMGGHWRHARAMRERHIADICVQAARHVDSAPQPPPPAPEPPAE